MEVEVLYEYSSFQLSSKDYSLNKFKVELDYATDTTIKLLKV
ncbi:MULTISPECIES: hypothetical protein [Methanobacterium]|nr:MULTISPECIES: hypothetical protein [Methanobacterium]